MDIEATYLDTVRRLGRVQMDVAWRHDGWMDMRVTCILIQRLQRKIHVQLSLVKSCFNVSMYVSVPHFAHLPKSGLPFGERPEREAVDSPAGRLALLSSYSNYVLGRRGCLLRMYLISSLTSSLISLRLRCCRR